MDIDSYYTQVSHFTAFQNFQSSVAKQGAAALRKWTVWQQEKKGRKSTLETGAQEANGILHYLNKHTHTHTYWILAGKTKKDNNEWK